jgi:hypothetical protein
MWQLSIPETEARWAEYMASGAHGRYDMIAGAKAVLGQLHDRYRLVAVTSRRAELSEITREWLDSNYPGLIDEVIHSGFYGKGNVDDHKMTKTEILLGIGAQYLIDDMPKHCLSAAEAGISTILFGNYGWNRDVELPDGVVRCKDWNAVQEYFDGR